MTLSDLRLTAPRPGIVGGFAPLDSGLLIPLEYLPSSVEGDNNWIAPTLVNSWINYGAPYDVAGYRKDSFGFVHLKGLIKSGTATAGTVLFTLPAGYRPGATGLFDAQSNGSLGRVDVNSSGQVTIQVGTNAWISLNGITFFGDV